MRIVIWEDENGYKHRALLRDTDPETMAHMGVPLDPPDLSQLDWDEIVKQIHNGLVEQGLHNWQDVQLAQNGISNAILRAVKKPIVHLFKEAKV